MMRKGSPVCTPRYCRSDLLCVVCVWGGGGLSCVHRAQVCAHNGWLGLEGQLTQRVPPWLCNQQRTVHTSKTGLKHRDVFALAHWREAVLRLLMGVACLVVGVCFSNRTPRRPR